MTVRLPSHPHPHPEVPRSGLEGDLQGSRGWLEASFEARLRLAPQDEGAGGIEPPALKLLFETNR